MFFLLPSKFSHFAERIIIPLRLLYHPGRSNRAPGAPGKPFSAAIPFVHPPPAKAHGFHEVVLCDSLEEAIDVCYENAVSGDAVLLSPACASWGMFKNYEQRGDIFKAYVRQLAE